MGGVAAYQGEIDSNPSCNAETSWDSHGLLPWNRIMSFSISRNMNNTFLLLEAKGASIFSLESIASNSSKATNKPLKFQDFTHSFSTMKSEIRPLVIAPIIAPIVNIEPNIEYCKVK